MVDTIQQDKEGLVEYMDWFKQEKSIVKIRLEKKNWVVFFKQLRSLRKLMKCMMQIK